MYSTLHSYKILIGFIILPGDSTVVPELPRMLGEEQRQ